MDEKKMTLMERCINFMERDTRGIQIVTYGVTSVGLLIALYRIRPFAKFTKPLDVPKRFIRLKVPLQGTVERIEPRHGALIMVNHKPLVNLPRFGVPQHLPLKVAGVNVNNHGISWLETVVKGKEIEFIPVARKNEYLDCTITLPQTKEGSLSIGEELVKLGFGTVENVEAEILQEDKKFLATYKAKLDAAQKRAKLERNGHWHFVITPTYLWKIRYLVHAKMSQALPARLSRQMRI